MVPVYRIEIGTFIKCKIDTTSSNALKVKKGKVEIQISTHRGEIYYGGGYASLNK